MKTALSRYGIPLIVAVFASIAICIPIAKSQVLASPSYQSIGVASTGNSSMVWLHEPASGRVVVCQSVAAPGAGLTGAQCAVAKLPYPSTP